MGIPALTMLGASRLFVLLEDYSGPLCLALLMLVLALQVAGRAMGFGLYLTWTDEAARFLFVWSVFLSMPLASKRGAMIHIKLSEKLWPGILKTVIPFLSKTLWSLTALALAVISFINISGHLDYPQITPVLGLNHNYLALVVPFSFLMIFLRGLAEISFLKSFRGRGTAEREGRI